MDISTLLPLIGGDEKTAALLSSLAGGDKTAILGSIMGDSGNGNAAKILGLMSAMNGKKSENRARPAPGLNAITPFATSDIIGRLYKLLQ